MCVWLTVVSRYDSLWSINTFSNIDFMSLLCWRCSMHISSRQYKLVCHPQQKLPCWASQTESACNQKIMKLQFYVWIFFRLIGNTWNKVQLGLTLQLKSSLLTAWVLERFRLWGHTTNLITIVSGILHRGERTRQQQPKGLYANLCNQYHIAIRHNPLTNTIPIFLYHGQWGKYFLHNSGSIWWDYN